MVSSEEDGGTGRALAELRGTELGGRYVLDRVLGTGGMGAVFEAKDRLLGRAVAIKVMRPGQAGQAGSVRRFLREAQTASQIRHRNVVVVLDYGEAEGGLVYFVMERLVGRDLEALLRERPSQRMPWEEAYGLLMQLVSGLRAAHAQGVIHRDIKPGNCVVTVEDDEPVAKLVDFGIAKLDDAAQTQQLTSAGDVVGTPSYIAPELVLGSAPASARSDVYSLGVLAYRMLTGALPFSGRTGFEVMHRACIDPVPPMRRMGVDPPAGVEALVLEMLAKDPAQRPADMGILRQRLLAFARGTGAAVVEIPVSGPLPLDVVVDDKLWELPRTSVLTAADPLAAGSVPEVTEVWRDPPPEPLRRSARPAAEPPAVVVEPSAGPEPMRAGVTTLPMVEAATWPLAVAAAREEPRRSKPWRWVAGAAALAMVATLGWISWSMRGSAETDALPLAVRSDAPVIEPRAAEPTVEPPKTDALVAAPAKVEPERQAAKGAALAGPPLPTPAEPAASSTETAEAAAPPVVPAESDEPKPVSTAADVVKVVKRPAGPPTDAVIKKRLERKIASACEAAMAGERVTVSFYVTNEGEVKLPSAIPKNEAGTCAKEQVMDTTFRARSGDDTLIKIVVE